jgi:hypothetical protein
VSPAIGMEIDARWVTVPVGAVDAVVLQMTGEDVQALGARLRAARQRLGMSVAAAAAALGGMDELALSALEAGRRTFVLDESWDAALLQLSRAAATERLNRIRSVHRKS